MSRVFLSLAVLRLIAELLLRMVTRFLLPLLPEFRLRRLERLPNLSLLSGLELSVRLVLLRLSKLRAERVPIDF